MSRFSCNLGDRRELFEPLSDKIRSRNSNSFESFWMNSELDYL